VLAAHPAVQRLENRLGISVLTSAGLPFLALGAVFALPAVGVLTPEIVTDLRPAFNIGLAWVGFVIGMQFDLRWLNTLPRGTSAAAFIQAAPALVVSAALCALALVALGVPLESPTLYRDVLILCGCAAASAPLAARTLAPVVGDAPAREVETITRLDECIPLAVLALAAIIYRPTGVMTAWIVPPTVWAIIIAGLGALCGVVTWVLLRSAHGEAERMALLLGSIALVAGTASHLALPPAVLCLIAGALVSNLPLEGTPRLREMMITVERPMYLVFLLIAGAGWKPGDWQGWLLAVVFVAARLIGKRLGALWASRAAPGLPEPGPLARLLVPLSPVAIVVIVSAAALFPTGEPLRWAVNAVIVGGVLSEIISRMLRGTPATPAEEALEPRVPGAPAPAP